MDQKQIEEIVRSVMASMGQAAPAPSEAKVRHHHLRGTGDLGKLRAGLRLCGSKSVDWC
ncbi:ethanolamine ammonia-lyase [Escherichia coli]|nr:ethanolamine ammonia-lyase [Escherichia coli]